MKHVDIQEGDLRYNPSSAKITSIHVDGETLARNVVREPALMSQRKLTGVKFGFFDSPTKWDLINAKSATSSTFFGRSLDPFDEFW